MELSGHQQRGSIRRARAAQRSLNRRRTTGAIAAIAAFSIALLGATPAFAEGEPPVDGLETTQALADPEPPAADPVSVPEPAPVAAPVPAAAPAAVPAPAPEPAPPASEPPAVQHEEPEPQPMAGSAPADAATVQAAQMLPGDEEISKQAKASADPEPPFLRWQVVDEGGALVPGATVTAQGARAAGAHEDADSGWAGAVSMRVGDNTGQDGYAGPDLDPAPGVIAVQRLVDDLDPSRTHEVSAGDTGFRLRAEEAPGEVLLGEAADWTIIPVTLDANAPAPSLVLAQPAAAKNATPDALESRTLDDGPAMGLMALGPDGADAPYVHWTVRDTSGELVSGATFTFQRRSGNSWVDSRTVTDCTSAGCTAHDRDSEAGEFLVKWIMANPGANPSGTGAANVIQAGGRYLLTPATAPAGYTWVSTTAVDSNNLTWDGSGSTSTLNFGDFVLKQNPPTNSSFIEVKVGAARTGTSPSAVSGLQGVQLGLYANATGGSALFTCTSNAGGVCRFTIPNTQASGTNRDRRYYVRQISAPAGWYTNPNLRTGGASGSGTSTAYRFQTGTQLRSGQTYLSTADFMYSASDTATASGGIWQQSKDNPTLPQSCGLDVALILDLSGSVGNSVGNLRSAANTFTDALVGTQSRMSLFSFSWGTPADGASQNYPALVPVSTQAQANAFKARYASWTASGGTNWDRGLGAAAFANTVGNQYEIAVIITDGNPTNYAEPRLGTGSNNRLVETEFGIFSANALKQNGTRVLAFGVGDGATGTTNALNLRAISGPILFNGSNAASADYYQTTNYAAVGTALRNLALGNCAGQLTVTKMVVPESAPAGSIESAVAADEGWQFTASNPGSGLTVPSPVQTTTNDGTGTVTFPLTFAGGTSSAQLTVTETQQAGYTLVPVNGQNAVCINLETGQTVPLAGNVLNGFRVAASSTAAINCTVYNRAPDLDATVRVDKTWVIEDTDGATLHTYTIPQGDGDPVPGWLTASPTIQSVDTPQWGTVYPGFVKDQQVAIGETASIDTADHPGCLLTSQLLTGANGAGVNPPVDLTGGATHTATLTEGANTFGITNTVTCATSLTLVKHVTAGSAPASDWDLTAAPSGGTATTVAGDEAATASNTFAVQPDTSHALTEALADPGSVIAYFLDRVEQCAPDANLPGGFDPDACIEISDPSDVSVGLGQHTIYRFVNQPAPMVAVPLTGGLSSDAFGIAGAGLAALAAIIGYLYWNRKRRLPELP